MATSRTFSTMLNEYLTNEIMAAEIVQRDYVLQQLEIDNGWKTGTMPVPFEGAYASSISFGALSASNDISEDSFVRGSISSPTEVWGSMVFNHRDLMEHDGKIPETTFLRILPNRLDNFMNYMKEVVSMQLTQGPHFAKVTTDAAPTSAASGILAVDKVDRFTIGQKVTLDDDNSSQGDYYVIAVNLNPSATTGGTNGTITLSAARGSTAADVSAYTASQNAKFYHPGVWDGTTASTFVSLRRAYLSSANGGDATLHGQTKTAYPHLQAVNVDGSDITASNILDKLFDAYTVVRQRARGNAREFLMSYKHLGSVMKALEVQKGPYLVTKQASASLYGWTEIEIQSVKGSLKVVGIQEMLDSEIFLVDWSSMKFCTNGFFRKRKSPDGIEYFEVRATTGYQYIVDICLFGELAHRAPSNNGVIYGISY
jgi:hypothetical protein